MEYDIIYTEELGCWLLNLSDKEKIDVLSVINLLEKLGPRLGYPYSSKIHGSKYSHMRELRIQHKGKPYRILYAFDPNRSAILLVGSRKTDNGQWYEKSIAKADKLYFEHLKKINEE